MRLVNVGKLRGDQLKGVTYVGRRMNGQIKGEFDLSVLGNPFVIGRDGTRTEVIAKYREWLWERVKREDDAVTDALLSLTEGTTLGCWCCEMDDAGAEGQLVCHGQVISRAAQWLVARLDRIAANG